MCVCVQNLCRGAHGIMATLLDCNIVVSWTPVVLLHSVSDKYPLERYEPTYPSSYGLIESLFLNNDGFGIK